MNFICPDIVSHEETHGCFFDLKLHKADIKLSMRKGRICDPCRKKFEEAIDGDTYNSLLRLIKYLNDKANSNENLPPKKPKVFIASSSSSDGIKIAEYLQVGLDTVTESTIWSQGSFSLTGGYLESLIKFAPQYDYAIIVLTPDDLITKKGQTENSPRDNVIFELGLFMGSIGRDHTFIVKCRDDKLDLPSDLDGIAKAEFNRRSNGISQAALAPVCVRLKEAMGINW